MIKKPSPWGIGLALGMSLLAATVPAGQLEPDMGDLHQVRRPENFLNDVVDGSLPSRYTEPPVSYAAPRPSPNRDDRSLLQSYSRIGTEMGERKTLGGHIVDTAVNVGVAGRDTAIALSPSSFDRRRPSIPAGRPSSRGRSALSRSPQTAPSRPVRTWRMGWSARSRAWARRRPSSGTPGTQEPALLVEQ